jgi:hypothetical protein
LEAILKEKQEYYNNQDVASQVSRFTSGSNAYSFAGE